MIIMLIIVALLIAGALFFLKKRDSDVGMQGDVGNENEMDVESEERMDEIEVSLGEETDEMSAEHEEVETVSAGDMKKRTDELKEQKQNELDSMNVATVTSGDKKDKVKSAGGMGQIQPVDASLYVEHRLICEADSEEKAKKIAERVDGTLVKYAYGIGVIEIEDTVAEALARVDKMVFNKPAVYPDFKMHAD